MYLLIGHSTGAIHWNTMDFLMILISVADIIVDVTTYMIFTSHCNTLDFLMILISVADIIVDVTIDTMKCNTGTQWIC